MKTLILKREGPAYLRHLPDADARRAWVFSNGRLALCYEWGKKLGLGDSVKVEVSDKPLVRGKLLKLWGKLSKHGCVARDTYGAVGEFDGKDIEDIYTGLFRAVSRAGFDREQRLKGVWVRFTNLKPKTKKA